MDLLIKECYLLNIVDLPQQLKKQEKKPLNLKFSNQDCHKNFMVQKNGHVINNMKNFHENIWGFGLVDYEIQ